MLQTVLFQIIVYSLFHFKKLSLIIYTLFKQLNIDLFKTNNNQTNVLKVVVLNNCLYMRFMFSF